MSKILTAVAVALASLGASAQWATPGDSLPAYHSSPPAKGETLPPILSGAQLTGENFTYDWQKEAYRDAAKIPRVIYQLPCYCRCDRAMGHQSLHSCFEGLHGAECSTCSKEAIFAYQQTLKGKTVAQIREAIERGDWRQVMLG